MSVNYASRLSDYDYKGKCGLPELFDSPTKLEEKVTVLCDLLTSCRHAVVHTGAGISTSAGIPDFRGPKGVWTLEQQGKEVETEVTFGDATPTLTHMALVALVEAGRVKHIVSQNVDGLHLKSGLPRANLSELHGNMFMEKCEKCRKEFIRSQAVDTVGLKRTGTTCSKGGAKGRCRGKLRDTVLDWEDSLPTEEIETAEYHSKLSDLSICLGTTLQIVPAGKLPLSAKKNEGGKLVLCNLQPTRYDKQADLIIHAYVDDIMVALMKSLAIPIPTFC